MLQGHSCCTTSKYLNHLEIFITFNLGILFSQVGHLIPSSEVVVSSYDWIDAFLSKDVVEREECDLVALSLDTANMMLRLDHLDLYHDLILSLSSLSFVFCNIYCCNGW